MNKTIHLLLGIVFWLVTFFAMLYQIEIKDVPVVVQFLFLLIILLLSTSNEAALLTTLHVEKKQFRKNLKYYLYLVINLFFIVFGVYAIILIYLFT